MVVDAGNALLARKARPGEAGWDQAVVKAEIVAEGLALGGIDAMALGDRDWALGMDKVLALQAAHGLPILAANLECDGQRPFPGAKLIQAGSHTVGVVGLTAGEVDGCEVLPLEAAAGAVVEVAGADVVVVLSPVDRGSLERWLESTHADLVIDGVGSRKLLHPEALDGAWWLHAGPRGQLLGLSELTWSPGAVGWVPTTSVERLEEDIERYEERLAGARLRLEAASTPEETARFEGQVTWYEDKIATARAEQVEAVSATGNRFGYRLVQLEGAVGSHAPTAEAVARGKDLVDVAEPPPPPESLKHKLAPEGSPFAGSDACATCHAEQDAQWQGTSHATAWASLGEHHRMLDRQCLGCHVTGWEAEGGPAAPAEIGPFRGVQCEACHGPSAAHVAAPVEARPVADPPEETCVGCHDGVQDRGRFHWDSYRPKVVH